MPETFAGFDWDAGNHAKCQKHGVTIPDIETLVFRAVANCPRCNAFEIGDTDSGARQDRCGPNDIFGVYDSAQGRSVSGSADQRALYACERGRFL
jgi:hypothetical protein